MPDANYADLLGYLAREQVKILEKKQMGASLAEAATPPVVVKTEITPPLTTAETEPQIAPLVETKIQITPLTEPLSGSQLAQNKKTDRIYISVHDRRWVMRRAQGQCEFVSEDGRRCQSRHKLQLDHIVPLCQGGRNERTNYRITCRSHNLYFAQMNLGSWMSQYVPSLK
jgi:5-methylcytosine-specific restriction endonuclease McrA